MKKTILQGKWQRGRGKRRSHWNRLTADDRRTLDRKIDQMIDLFQERLGYTPHRSAHAFRRYVARYNRALRRKGMWDRAMRSQKASPARARRPMIAGVMAVGLAVAGTLALARIRSNRRRRMAERSESHEFSESLSSL